MEGHPAFYTFALRSAVFTRSSYLFRLCHGKSLKCIRFIAFLLQFWVYHELDNLPRKQFPIVVLFCSGQAIPVQLVVK